MVEFVAQTVRDVIENPSPDDETEVLVGISDSARDSVQEWIESNGGTVEREVGFDMLLVTLPEQAVVQLTELEGIDSVDSPESSLEVLPAGNAN